MAAGLGALCAARRIFLGFGLVAGPMLIARSTGADFDDGTFFALHYLYLLVLGGAFTIGASLEL